MTETNLKTCTKCREYFKQSRLNNRDEINEKAKERYQENKEVKNERSLKWQAENIDKLTTQVECACGGKMQHRHKSKHNKTQKHQKYMSSLTII